MQLVGTEVDGVPIRIVIVVHLAAQLNVLCESHPIGVFADDVTGMDLGIVIPLIDVNLDRVGLALLTGVIGLSACGRVIATLLEPVVQPQLLLDEWLPRIILVVVASGNAGTDTGPDGRTGRVANCGAGVRVCERHAHGRKTVEVWSQGLLVALGRVLVEVSHPIVQIVNGDHQNVGLVGKGRCGPTGDGQEKKRHRHGGRGE